MADVLLGKMFGSIPVYSKVPMPEIEATLKDHQKLIDCLNKKEKEMIQVNKDKEIDLIHALQELATESYSSNTPAEKAVNALKAYLQIKDNNSLEVYRSENLTVFRKGDREYIVFGSAENWVVTETYNTEITWKKIFKSRYLAENYATDSL